MCYRFVKAINILTAGFKCCKSLWKEPRKPDSRSSSGKEGWGSGRQRSGETYISLYILLHLLDFVNVLINYFYFKIWKSKDVTLPFQSKECLHLIETGENLANHQDSSEHSFLATPFLNATQFSLSPLARVAESLSNPYIPLLSSLFQTL